MDIKIIGGGAAGLIAALYLNEEGYKPTIFEKQSKNNYSSTPCGEGISLNKLKELERETGFDSIPYISKKAKGIKLIFPNNCQARMNKKFALLNRTSWQKGMIDFLEDKGIKVEFSREVKGKNDLDYDYLIGAEGVNSNIRKGIGGDIKVIPTCQYKMKLEREIEYLRCYMDEMFYKNGKKGYGWVFQKKDHFNVGCSGSFSILNQFLEKYGIEGEIIKKEAYPIGVSGTKFMGSSNNILLTGGAAGLTNPITGEGLNPIIKASKLIVEHIKGEKGYKESIESSHLNPKTWKSRSREFYTSNSIFKSVGRILDNKNVFELSFSTKLKAFLHPETLLYLIKAHKTVHEISETF